MANNLMVVIAAAGTGSRMNSMINKQYMLLGGKPVLYYSLNCFSQMEQVQGIIVVAHPEEVDYCQTNIVEKYQFPRVNVIPGGASRQESVQAGLDFLDAKTSYVAVHDGARPLIKAELVLKVFQEAKKHGAAIPAIMATDTMKVIDKDGFVINTLDRKTLISVQTPQIFNYAGLLKAYEEAARENFTGTDDASLYEKYIGRVKALKGDNLNLKITSPEDLIIAEELIIKRGENN
ncbi:MAG TPA: 2-C-methyl-D-erythritol 4-phosphate cytidylyltransferase [Syntrophomonadaceae bacterium]|nr:2-C-methyl-D-erythritol 4-phosphate cytidylyltransferase [Syntrophomonadaceae bacterium]